MTNSSYTAIISLLWVAATALAIWGALDVSMGQLQRYIESPTVVTLEKDFRAWRYSLPAVTVCYRNRVDPSKLPSAIKKHWDIDSSDEKYEYYSRFVDAVANSDLFHLNKFEEFKDLETNVDLFQIAVDVMPEAQIKTVSSEAAIVFKWTPVMSEGGVCHVTNSLALGDTAIMSSLNSSWILVSDLDFDNNGTNLDVYPFNCKKYFPDRFITYRDMSKPNQNDSKDLPVSCKHSSLNCYIVMDVTSTADFFIHSPYDIMDYTHAPSEVFLTLTRKTELSVMESRCGRGVKELQPKRRGCLFTDEPTSSWNQVYSTNTCRLGCRRKLAMKYCGCVPFYYFYEEGPQCTAAGMWCLAAYSSKFPQNDGEKCACPPQCNDCVYKDVINSDSIWDRLPFKLRGSVKFVVQAPRTRYLREIVFHFQDLVVSFGGAAGLFLGASFISFVEIFYFLLATVFKTVVKKDEKNEIKVKEIKKGYTVQQNVPFEALRIKHLTALLDGQPPYKGYDTRTTYYYRDLY